MKTKQEMLHDMLNLQDQTNRQLDPNWKEQDFDFNTAIVVEVGELMDHFGYKWWSEKKEPDWDQIRMELVDIWHFILSRILQESNSNNSTEVLRLIAEKLDADWFKDDCLINWSHRLIEDNYKSINNPCHLHYAVGDFLIMCKNANLTFAQLYKLYIGKAALNRFRWETGYGKDYIKVWKDGLEDNEHLTKILQSISRLPTVDGLKRHLQDKYLEVNGC